MTKHLTFLTFALLAVLPVSAWSQSYEWIERQDASYLRKVNPTDYGTYSVGMADVDIHPPESSFGFLVKYDNETGKLLWQRRFAVEVWTEGHTQAVNDAGIFVGGQTYKSGDTPGFAPPVGFVRMFSHDGAVLWTKRDEEKMRTVRAAVADATGVYVGGDKYGNAGANRAVVRRLSNDGDYIWTRVMSETSSGVREIELVDGRLYVLAADDEIKIIQASDGAWIGSFPVAFEDVSRDMSYHGGFLYFVDTQILYKYSLAGEEIWRYVISRDGDLEDLYTLVATDDGIFLSAHLRRPLGTEEPVYDAMAIVQAGLDGTLLDITEYWGDKSNLQDLARRDGVLFGIGIIDIAGSNLPSYTARFSDQDLAPASILATRRRHAGHAAAARGTASRPGRRACACGDPRCRAGQPGVPDGIQRGPEARCLREGGRFERQRLRGTGRRQPPAGGGGGT